MNTWLSLTLCLFLNQNHLHKEENVEHTMNLIMGILFMLPINKLYVSNLRNQLLWERRNSKLIILTLRILILLNSYISFHMTFLYYVSHHHTQGKGLLSMNLIANKQMLIC